MVADSLERAVHYAAATVSRVTPQQLGAPTPCSSWDLGMLLRHACESLAALTEGFSAGLVSRCGPAAESGGDPALAFMAATTALLRCSQTARAAAASAATRAAAPGVVSIGGCPLTTSALAAVGALEIAVHGWDVAQACGGGRPIPAQLARDLLEVAPMLVADGDRASLFAVPVSMRGPASPSDRLAAFLGRSPLRPDAARGGRLSCPAPPAR